jgi:type IV secretion system protein VirD4
VVNLLLTQLVNHLADERLKPGERPLLMLLDEFANLGRLEPVLAMWKVLAGNGVAVWAFVQSLTDLDRFYGKDGRGVLLDNSELQIFLGGQSPEALEHFERLLGQRTVSVTSRSTSGGFMSQSRSHSTSQREVAVPLMSRDALRRLDPDRFVVLPLGEKPILARKNYVFGDPKLRRLAGLALPKGWRAPNLPAARKAAPGLGQAESPSEHRSSRRGVQPGATFIARSPAVTGSPSTPVPRSADQPVPVDAPPADGLGMALAELDGLADALPTDRAEHFEVLMAKVAARVEDLADTEADELVRAS